MRRGLATTFITAGLLAGGAVPAQAYDPPGRTTRLTPAADIDGEPFPGAASEISGDGQIVAIATGSRLVAEDTNGTVDIYVRPRLGGEFELASLGDDGSIANGWSFLMRLSHDGRFLAFESLATNLAGTDANASTQDIYVRDLERRRTFRASVSSGGAQANAPAYGPDISADGRHVVFTSSADNLVAGDANEGSDVFVRDLVAGTTELATLRADGSQTALNTDIDPVISGDGRYVAFSTYDPMVPEDTNAPARDVYVHDRVTGTNERVSVASDGSEGPLAAFYPQINHDGRFVVFSSFNANFVPHDTNGASESFVHDRQTGITERISVTRDGGQGNNVAGVPAISADGRFVLYGTLATNMGWADENGDSDVYRYDRLTRTTELVSVATSGTSTGQQWSYQNAMSGDGRFILFGSDATDIATDGEGGPGAYLRDLGPPLGVGDSSRTATPNGVQVDGWARFAGATVAEVLDPAGDMGPVHRAAGADLTGARVVYRPEPGDLRLQLDLAPRPHPYPPLVGTDAPKPGAGLAYTVELQAEGGRMLIRAVDGPVDDSFTIQRCTPVCVTTGSASGGIGTESERVLIAAPLAALGLSEGDRIAGGLATVTLEGPSGAAWILDQAILPAAEIPRAALDLGTAPAGTPPADVAFDHAATITNGRFGATLPAPAGSAIWARACLGDLCTFSPA